VACAALASVASAVEVTITNRASATIYVATAYRQGEVNSKGWTKIDPNKSKTFRADNDLDMHLRIELNGKEKTVPGFNTFISFYCTSDQYLVTPVKGKDAYLLKWGDKLEHSKVVAEDGQLPAGWAKDGKRFFQSGKKNVALEVK
jgi:hypothetical protein